MVPDNIPAFMAKMLGCTTLESARDFADEVMAVSDPDKRKKLLITGTQVNPLFVPDLANKQGVALSASQWVNAVALARMSAANANQRRIIVSAPMKTGSTFLADLISRAAGLPKLSLMMPTVQPYYFVLLGAGSRDHEIDELALLTACLNGVGFVAHHHMNATPYLANQAKLYSLRIVLVKRNIFDCLVSLDDFVSHSFDNIKDDVEHSIRHLLPRDWPEYPEEERFSFLIDRYLLSYIRYYVSWRLLDARGDLDVHWLSYEDDILGDRSSLALEVASAIGADAALAPKIEAQIARDGALKDVNFNKGVQGRGAKITGTNRARVIEAIEKLRNIVDLTDLI